MTDPERYLILIEGGPSSNYSAWMTNITGRFRTLLVRG